MVHRGALDGPVGELIIDPIADGLALAGEIDAGNVAHLTTALRGVTELSEVSLDMQGVYFIDSSGLRVLIEAHQDLEAAGRRLVLRRPSPGVSRLLTISGVEGYLHLES